MKEDLQESVTKRSWEGVPITIMGSDDENDYQMGVIVLNQNNLLFEEDKVWNLIIR